MQYYYEKMHKIFNKNPSVLAIIDTKIGNLFDTK